MGSIAAFSLPRRPKATAGIAIGAAMALVAAAWLAPTWQRGLVLVLIGPALEETVFRAGVQEALGRWLRSATAANLFTALLFAAAHVAVRSDLQAGWVALPAIAIGCVYSRSRRLAPCIALHAAMNVAWLAWQAG